MPRTWLARRFLVLIACALFALHCPGTLFAQTTPVEGIRKNTPTVHAFVNARIVTAPGKVLEHATLVIRDGVIVSVGNPAPPADARIWDLAGMTVYPGLIDAYSEYGMPRPPQRPDPENPGRRAAPPPPDLQRGPAYWNNGVLAQQNAAELFVPDPRAAGRLRSQGFTSALVVPPRGIIKGTSALVNLGEGKPNELIVRAPFAQHVCLDVNQALDRYPTSLMGLIALVRQSFYDADWYQKARETWRKRPDLPRPETNETLDALHAPLTGAMPVVIETANVLDPFRAETIAKEFNLKLILLGSGKEFGRLEAIASLHRPVILPLDFPEVPAVGSPEDALQLSLADLQYWDAAPENPRRLRDAGVQIAFTAAGLKDTTSFLTRVRQAVQRGLSPDDALAALTTAPAELFGVTGKMGTLEPGKLANFIITSGDLFKPKTIVRESWIDGKRYEIRPAPEIDPRGTWSLLLSGLPPSDSLTLSLKGEPDSLKGSVRRSREVRLSSATLAGLRLLLALPGDSLGWTGIVRLTGVLSPGSLEGTGEWPDGKPLTWSARRTAPFTPEPDTPAPKPPEMASFPTLYPFGEFGRSGPPGQPPVVMVRNAVIWTSGPQGVIENGDVVFEKEKVRQIGRQLPVPPGAVVIDGTGKHVTPGIIDCHSHMSGDGGINETGFALSPEVRIGDVIDCEDINLYRNLAGGVTVSHVLHGSANPIGGQNQLIKLRWGLLPDQMKFEGWKPTIKFALGENVKQSNWQTPVPRYPQTRMGVEQIMRDEFRAAQDYEKAWKKFEDNRSGMPPRRNLGLDAILEVLHGSMFVHCHSYRQDEILTMMRVADDFGFKIRAFQHILEGYKVADVMARHGAGGSSFSDWWAYKFEVYDAIPYNGVLMHNQGVLVSYNSDSDELSRRLNTEAAKAVKYGGLSKEEALKFVTINPAKQLFIDGRVGSLEPGKDADFVIWSGDPLSTYSVCEQTWIDGRRYFDREEDRRMTAEVEHERAVLVQKALKQKKGK